MSIGSIALAKEPKQRFRDLDGQTRRFIGKAGVTLFAVILMVGFLLPLVFMGVTSLKTEDQLANQQILPKTQATVTITSGEFAGDHDLLTVPLPDGTSSSLALVQPGRESSGFVDPADPDVLIEWEGRWRTLEPSYAIDPTFENFGRAWDRLEFLRLLRNTGIIAGLGMAGTVISSTLVAYGLSRFRMRFKGLIIGSLVATIILPRFVTLIPTYALFSKIGWVGTWWPLIVPHFFANAYNVFLLRQFFLTIPRDLDEAAEIDGAGPLKTLITVILPQAKGAILAIALFHFFFAWNDFLEPLIYLSGRRDLQPISVGLYEFLGLYDTAIPLVQAGAILSMAVPILVFLSLQKIFLGGIDLSGSLK
ncbi:carbohydrate ABC transporter permease [Ilumatobacter coccineus]|jgi:multiple sugar transport system permease protein|uniref:Putative ABC transporter permease protein n=1 Tax=Ilumatobacter coccineus (strain NBRC 103263 / KCTC 29153 / YM16-304) TaxID=1313172 RepID=A0A6C7EDH1_ILUCY|nr:carbohydrate ABC transporter permease [Ilumatobacter coccineus]BAN04420.1 putative ABC transporter permease protein [Ilumatobacter coccineus YM16-304]